MAEQSSNSSDQIEQWKPVVGFEGLYSISNLGRVRSDSGCRRTGHAIHAGMIRKAKITRTGYFEVNLYKNGRYYFRKVHQLVLLAFNGPRPPGHIINHINGIKTDNRPENLEWATHSQNLQHAYDTGLTNGHDMRGECHPQHKLTNEQVREIRSSYVRGFVGNCKNNPNNSRRLCTKYGVTKQTIRMIVKKKLWPHLDP